jgi:hypothetical protein
MDLDIVAGRKARAKKQQCWHQSEARKPPQQEHGESKDKVEQVVVAVTTGWLLVARKRKHACETIHTLPSKEDAALRTQ